MALFDNRLSGLLNHEVVGLDIGSSWVRYVHLKISSGRYEVVSLGQSRIKLSEQLDGPSDSVIIQAIRDCLKTNETQNPMVVCGARGSDVAVRYFSLPSISADEARPAIMLEVSQVCPFGSEGCVVDYQLTGNGQQSLRGFLVATTRELVNRQKKLIRAASLKPVLMDVDGLAVLNCFTQLTGNQQSATTAILNVGSCYTTLAILNEQGIPSVRDMNYAGNDIIEQIAEDNDLSEELVEGYLYGENSADIPALDFSTSFARATHKLMQDVAETIRYSMAKGQSKVVDKILLCGGFALVDGFCELIGNYFPGEVVLWNPLSQMRILDESRYGETAKSYGSAFAVATGLAMRTI